MASQATASNTTGTDSRANWNEQEITALVDYLYEHRSEAGDGGNFKNPTFNAAAVVLAPLLTHGAKKTGPMCKMKYNSIKTIYIVINIYHNQSGFHWDNGRGANIEGSDAESVWAMYLQAKGNGILCPFQNAGWPHFDKIQAIVPAGAGAHGHHVFRPTIALPYSPKLVDSAEAIEASGAVITEGAAGSIQMAVASGNTAIFSDSDTNTSNPENTIVSCFQKDHSLSSSTSVISTSTSKCTHSTISADSNDPQDSQHVSDATSHNLNSVPAKKRVSKAGSHHSGVVRGVSRRPSARMANQASQTAAIMGMQGSINHLTNVFAESLCSPKTEAALHRKHALQLLQEQNDQLTPIQKAHMAACFQKDILAADTYVFLIDTYVSLFDPHVREQWINLMLAD